MFHEHPHDDTLLPPNKRLKLDAPALQRKDQCSSAPHRSNTTGCSRLSAASFSFTPLSPSRPTGAENPAPPRSIWQQHPYQQPSCGGNNKAAKGFEAYSSLGTGDGEGPSGPSSSVASLRAWAAAVKASAAAAVEASFDGWRGGADARLADVEDDASSPPLLPSVEGIDDAEPAPYSAADVDEQSLCCEDDDDGAAGLAAFVHEDLMDPCMGDDDDGMFAFAVDDFQFDA